MSDIVSVVLLISAGFILLLIELFTPGFGLTGISGLILIIIGCYLAYMKLSLIWGIVVSVASVLAIIGFFKLFVKSFVWKRIRLESKEARSEGFSSTKDLSSLLNKEGVTISALRPTGIALIDGRRIDATAENLFIDKDKRVKVVRVEGSRVMVREVK